MTEPDPSFEPLGKHLLRVEGDTVFLVARGSLTLDDMRTLLARYEGIKHEYGCLFVLYDARQGTGIDSDARQYAARRPARQQEADLQVAFGISFALRVLVNMMIRAQGALRSRAVNFYAFDKEIEARKFFAAEREKIRQGIKR